MGDVAICDDDEDPFATPCVTACVTARWAALRSALATVDARPGSTVAPRKETPGVQRPDSDDARDVFNC
jgi:hypothetical protein